MILRYNTCNVLSSAGADQLQTADSNQCTVQFFTVQSFHGPGMAPHSHKPAQVAFYIQILAHRQYLVSQNS
jgi:hypothetical protein